ncbi:hypothetical protein PIB30_047986 [Stylosanthes scabra]|uniref:Ubiquitin-like protease family profile domain-containing protein n=1 Tax=Stylosanthes scabra TaxID=79078 RepID=A0ABU6TGL4_9FABA|nr:hypothetical protein [Stylosanthes scabra]
MAVIKSLDEQVSANAPALETPQQTQVEDDDFEERVATWAIVPKGGNDYELIFDLRGPRVLNAMRFQFDSMAPKSYIDIQVVGLMCHVLNGEECERYEKMVYCISQGCLRLITITRSTRRSGDHTRSPHLPIIKSISATLTVKNSSPTDFSLHQSYTQNIGGYMFWIRMGQKSNILSQLLRWAGAPTILKKGSWSLLPTYINIPQQPNDYDCAVFVMKWMELIDPTKLHGCCTYNIEQWTDKKDRGKDNPEQGKYNESRCNKGGTRNVTNKSICCSS